jgi:hypothetical protein
MAALRTEFTFTLPKGYVDGEGRLHRHGTMRLSTARDEIEPLRSRDIDGPDDPYLTVLVLARVITELGTVPEVTPSVVEQLFAADLAFLQDLYGIINFGDAADAEALQASFLDDDELGPDPEPADGGSDGASEVASAESSSDDASAPASATRARASIEEVARPSGS